jgi:hypothetical protein
MVSRPCLSAKLHLKLALSDSGNRDWDADHVGGGVSRPLRPRGIVLSNEPVKDF